MTIWSSEIRELEKLHHSIKESHPRLEKELSRLLKTDDENIALVYARRCLEIIISDLCECELKRPRGSEPLKGIIDKLNREGKVPAHIIGSMNNINSISTFGSHPKAFDPRQVKPVLLDLNTTLGWYLKYDESRSVAETIIQEKDQGTTQDNIPEKFGSSRRRILQISAIAITGVVIVVVSVFFIIHPRTRQPEADESLAKSIAVLPFHNYSGDPNQDFICFGLTDEIITNLYKVESFAEVRSLTSVLNYKNPDRNVPSIAQELGVNYILEGTYKRMGNEIRITAQLIEPTSDKHIWQKDYDLPYNEIMGIPGEIAFQIADHLNAYLTVSVVEDIQKIPTTNPEAYETLKEALYLIGTEGFVHIREALEMVSKVIQLDTEYADAYAAAGHLSLWQGTYAGQTEIQYATLDAIPYFDKALELDQNNAMAHVGKGNIHEWARWDYTEAEKEYLKAFELEPHNPIVNMWVAEFFLKMVQLDNLWEIMDKDMALEPEQLTSFIKGQILSGNKQEAYTYLKSALSTIGYRKIGECYLWLEEYDSAKIYLEYDLKNEHPDMLSPRFQADLSLAYEKTNRHQQAQKIINRLIARSDTSLVGSPEYFTGWYYSAIGETDSAFYWLEKACRNRSPEMPWLKVDPIFKILKDDPRYWDLYERTGHKAYDEYLANQEKI